MLQTPFVAHTVCYTWTQLTGTARNQLLERAQKDQRHSDWPTVKQITQMYLQQFTVIIQCMTIMKNSACMSQQGAMVTAMGSHVGDWDMNTTPTLCVTTACVKHQVQTASRQTLPSL